MERSFSFQAVEDWLRCLGLLHYAQSFYDNGYEDLDTVKEMKEKDLDAIGMLNDSDREDIINAVRDLHQNVYFELKPDATCSLYRSKIDELELKGKLKKCVDRDNKRLKDGTVTDLYPLAIRYAAELSTFFDDVRDTLEEIREEEIEPGVVKKVETAIGRSAKIDQVRSEVLIQTAKKKYGKHAGNTTFTKILKKETPANIIHEDEKCIAFNDANPQAPVHFLVIPRLHIPCLQEAKDDDKYLLGHLMYVANECASKQGLDKDGYRIVLNNREHGANADGVRHLHIHVMGGREMKWPPG